MKNNWRNFVSFICSPETRWSGISSFIILCFIVRDVSTVKLFLAKHGKDSGSGRRVDQPSDKDNDNGDG